MQIDIGFGDVVYPKPELATLPTMLEYPAPQLLCYSRESAIAEKFEAMIKLGILNSRMKDFFDIWLLSRQFSFNSADLAEAIRLTFKKRKTVIPATIYPFTESFIIEKQIQWKAFRKRLPQDHIPSEFNTIIFHLDQFLTPVVSKLASGGPFDQYWTASGTWR